MTCYKLVLNTDKTMPGTSTYQWQATVNECKINLKVDDKATQQVSEAKLLGIIVDDNLTWEKHIDKLYGIIHRTLAFT